VGVDSLDEQLHRSRDMATGRDLDRETSAAIDALPSISARILPQLLLGLEYVLGVLRQSDLTSMVSANNIEY
jgi:hypothetical protein